MVLVVLEITSGHDVSWIDCRQLDFVALSWYRLPMEAVQELVFSAHVEEHRDNQDTPNDALVDELCFEWVLDAVDGVLTPMVENNLLEPILFVLKVHMVWEQASSSHLQCLACVLHLKAAVHFHVVNFQAETMVLDSSLGVNIDRRLPISVAHALH